MGTGGQRVAQRQHRFRGRRGTTGNAKAELKQRRAIDQTTVNQMPGNAYLTEVEHFQLWLHTQLLRDTRHALQINHAIDDHIATEVHAAAIQRADFR